MTDAVSLHPLCVCGHGSKMKETAVVFFVGGPAMPEQPFRTIMSINHHIWSQSGVVCVEQAARQPGGVPPPCPSPPVGPLPLTLQKQLVQNVREDQNIPPHSGRRSTTQRLYRSRPAVLSRTAQQTLPVAVLLRPHGFPQLVRGAVD